MGVKPNYLRESYPGAYAELTSQTTVEGCNVAHSLGSNFLLIEFQQINDAEVVSVNDPNVICVIGMYDPNRCEQLEEMLAEVYGIQAIGIDDYDPNCDVLVAIIGVPFDGTTKYKFSCPHVFWEQDFAKLISTFTSPEVTYSQYSRYLAANRELASDYHPVTLDRLVSLIEFWMS